MRSFQPAKLRPNLASLGNIPKNQYCPLEIPSTLLATLDKLDAYTVRRVLPTYRSLRVPFQNIYHSHLRQFTEAVTIKEPPRRQLSVESVYKIASPNKSPYPRRRRASLPDLTDITPLKRLRFDNAVHNPLSITPPQEHYLGYN